MNPLMESSLRAETRQPDTALAGWAYNQATDTVDMQVNFDLLKTLLDEAGVSCTDLPENKISLACELASWMLNDWADVYMGNIGQGIRIIDAEQILTADETRQMVLILKEIPCIADEEGSPDDYAEQFNRHVVEILCAVWPETFRRKPAAVRRVPVLSIQDGTVTLSGKNDTVNTIALLKAAHGTLLGLAMMLESAESLLPVDTLEAPRREAEKLACLIQAAIHEVKQAA